MKGGDVGVTAFFVLSGYGIFFSLKSLESQQHLTFCNFMRIRIKKIVPQYYFNIAILLLLSDQAIYLQKAHLMTIVSHLLFFHSWSFDWHGAINGVLWTMAVIFQFYLLAIPLYRLINRANKVWICVLVGMITTIFIKWLVLNYLWVEDEAIYGAFAYMIPGRQIITSLDNFLCGMCLAKVNYTREIGHASKMQKAMGIMSLLLLFLLCGLAVKYSIYTRTLWGCIWHSLLGGDICLIMYSISFISSNGIVSKILLFLSKHEYGIYLWHLPIIKNLVSNSEIVKSFLADGKEGLLYLILIAATIPISCVIDEMFQKKVDIKPLKPNP